MVEESENTIGVNILDGDAKVAVRKLSFPLMVSLVIGSLYYIVDAMWISGLGVDALTAIGFIIPLQFIILGIGAGLGIGKATSSAVDAIARQPEAESKISKSLLLGCALAEATAIYGFVIALLIILFLK